VIGFVQFPDFDLTDKLNPIILDNQQRTCNRTWGQVLNIAGFELFLYAIFKT